VGSGSIGSGSRLRVCVVPQASGAVPDRSSRVGSPRSPCWFCGLRRLHLAIGFAIGCSGCRLCGEEKPGRHAIHLWASSFHRAPGRRHLFKAISSSDCPLYSPSHPRLRYRAFLPQRIVLRGVQRRKTTRRPAHRSSTRSVAAGGGARSGERGWGTDEHAAEAAQLASLVCGVN